MTTPPTNAVKATAAETFWGIEELRYELFQWDFPKTQLAGMMVLEKKSLPEVVKALYREVGDVEILQRSRREGCSEARIRLYANAVIRIEQQSSRSVDFFSEYTLALLLPFIDLQWFQLRCKGSDRGTCTIVRGRDGGLYRVGTDVFYWHWRAYHSRDAGPVLFGDVPRRLRDVLVDVSCPASLPTAPAADFVSNCPPGIKRLSFISARSIGLSRARNPEEELPQVMLAAMKLDRLPDLLRVHIDVPHQPEVLRVFHACVNLAKISFWPMPGATMSALVEMLSVLGQAKPFKQLRTIEFTIAPADAARAATPSSFDVPALQAVLQRMLPSFGRLNIRLWKAQTDVELTQARQSVEEFIEVHLGPDWQLHGQSEALAGELRPRPAQILQYLKRDGWSASRSASNRWTVVGWRVLDKEEEAAGAVAVAVANVGGAEELGSGDAVSGHGAVNVAGVGLSVEA